MSLNVGEELAYWYFRLNGFFLIENFVLQKNVRAQRWEETGNAELYNADADLIGVRLANTFEAIGQSPDSRQSNECVSWDSSLWKELPLSSDKCNVAAIVQVKMGSIRDLAAFHEDRLLQCILRMGLMTPQDSLIDETLVELNKKAFSTKPPGWLVSKILFSNNSPPKTLQESFPHIHIKPTTAVDFMRSRFKEHTDKAGTWDRFPGSLMQFLAQESLGNV